MVPVADTIVGEMIGVRQKDSITVFGREGWGHVSEDGTRRPPA